MKKVFEKIELENKIHKKILILGLGAGSMVEVLNKKISSSQITGVDFDPEMIEIGKKYFRLDEYKNLKIVITDAYDYLNNSKPNKKFNLIISDLYIGGETKAVLRSQKFLRLIYRHLKKNGVYISNSSYLPEYKNQTEKFLGIVKSIFDETKVVLINNNLIISGYKKIL